MKIINKVLFIVFIIFVLLIGGHKPIKQTSKNIKPHLDIKHTNIPFVLNKGRFDPNVEFYTSTFWGTVFLTEPGDIIYHLPDGNYGSSAKAFILKEKLLNKKNVVLKGKQRKQTKVNYFRGPDRAKWTKKAPVFGQVEVGEVYDGISLSLNSRIDNIEKIFCINPGADPEKINIELIGGNNLKVNDEGELEVETELGNVKFTSPIAYQEYEKKREYIDVEYRIEGQCYGFTVGNYDHEQTLVIDPLIASTFIGGSGEEAGWSGDKIAVDEEGNIFFGGTTRSVNFPVSTGVIQENLQGNQDIFIAKFDSKLENLLACTYLGGTGNEERFSIQYKSGSLYVMGTSSSNDYPTTNGAYNRNYSGGNMDVFISRLNSELNILEASTYIGGSSDDKACSFSVGNEDGIYIAGSTNSTNFPTTLGAYDRSYNGGGQVGDIFLARINYDLSQIQMSTYFGGGGNEGSDGCCFIEIGNNGNIYIAGQTMSDDLPITPGAYDNSIGGWGDIFLSCFSSNLGTLISSTYLGGSGGDMPWDLAVDENNNPIICSHIESTDYPVTQNSYDPTHNGGLEMAITKLNSGLTEIIASTWVGGNSNDCPFSMKINEAGSIFVSGFTSSSDFPATAGSYDETYNNETDVFVLNINNDLSELIASTFIGGSSNDWLGWINLDNESNVIVGGFTSSSDFPTQLNSYDRSYNGGGDYFISILDSELSEPTYIISASAGDGGSISPLGEIQISWRGEISFTIAADEGYKISDVLVDGVSVGVVEQYVFEDVIEDHTIEALFEDNTSSAGFNNFEINVCENFPNPFTENTNFKFEIASPTDVSINIFNISGRLIRKVVDNCIFNNGTHTISWDAIDNEGNRIIPGIYFWNIKLNSFNSTGKIIYI